MGQKWRLGRQNAIAFFSAGIAALAFFAVHRQIADQTASLIRHGFTPRLDETIWTKNVAGGGMLLLDTGAQGLRPLMAALGLSFTGFMLSILTLDWGDHTLRLRRFAGLFCLVGLTLGVGSLIAPPHEIISVDRAARRLCWTFDVPECASLGAIRRIAARPVQKGINVRGYRVAVELADGRSLALSAMEPRRLAEDTSELLRETIAGTMKPASP